VVALREIAEETVSANDLREDLIHSMQKYVDVDEPEAETAAPAAAIEHEAHDEPSSPSQGDLASEPPMERMSEEDLLRGLEGLAANGKSG
jgi:DNA-directed RNA polymerase subunit omega